MVIMLAIIAVLPPLLERLVGGGALRWVLQIGGYILMVVIVAAALAVLYRVAPERDAPKVKWTSVGAIVATVIWLIASIGFSFYTSTFGNYAKTYGTLAGIVILLLWLWLTAYAILLGAEINAESEQQTVADTTKGPSEPLGERGAVKADSIPPDEPEKADAEKDTARIGRSTRRARLPRWRFRGSFWCSAEDVFAVLADGWVYPVWVVGASRMRAVDDDWPEVGSRLHHSAGAWPLLIDDTSEVLAYDPPRAMVLQARGWPAGEARVEITVEPS